MNSNRYNIYCTNFGCFQGIARDDIDNGWPTWNPLDPSLCHATLPGVALTPGVAPPLWTYTVPQGNALQSSYCGPRGCGPMQLPIVSPTGFWNQRHNYCIPASF